ncbi:MAG: hypothetical protein NTY70_15015 [Burkholderiales bacterium]|nr:hypothetical protein [Burkholderiales bacterium]
MLILPWRKLLSSLVCSLLCIAFPATSFAEIVALKLPSLSGKRHLYFVGLLDAVLLNAGHTPKISVSEELPQNRAWYEVERGSLSLYWGLPTSERDSKFIPIGHGITGGMIGQRLILTRPANLPAFANISTLDDLRASGKVAGLGEGWVDVAIWNKSRLPIYVQAGDWTQMFRMVADGRFKLDYLSRSVLEITEEVNQGKLGLVIEPNLLLSYDLDMHFYLSRHSAHLQAVLEQAFAQAESSGLIKKFSQNYYKNLIVSLGLNDRRKLQLPLP